MDVLPEKLPIYVRVRADAMKSPLYFSVTMSKHQDLEVYMSSKHKFPGPEAARTFGTNYESKALFQSEEMLRRSRKFPKDRARQMAAARRQASPQGGQPKEPGRSAKVPQKP